MTVVAATSTGRNGLFAPDRLPLVRAALRAYTPDSVNELLGMAGHAALARGDLAGTARAIRGHDEPLATLVRLFLLGADVAAGAAQEALAPLGLDEARASGLVVRDGSLVRALIDVRPYGEAAALTGALAAPGPRLGGPHWWVVSDLGTDVRPGPLAADHVLGVGAASLTLAQATPREPVTRALDLGTGSGVQALHLSAHAERVVATDVSARALRLAATTAALSGQTWDLRQGSLLEPVAGERFDLVVANPPFVVSDGASGWAYRDGGLAGDGVSERLVRELPAHLNEDGSAHLLANWVVPADGDWRERVGSWLAPGCDAWVWQREVAEPGEYVTLWLRDAGLTPDMPQWTRRYDDWLDWLAASGVVAIGMGMVSLWRTDSRHTATVLEDVPQAYAQPVGAQLPAWRARQHWLADTDDHRLLSTALRAAAGLVLDRSDLLASDGWSDTTQRLRQSHGLRWVVDTDNAVAALVAACDGSTPVSHAAEVLAAALDRPATEIAQAVLPVVRDLVARGFLLPPDEEAEGSVCVPAASPRGRVS